MRKDQKKIRLICSPLCLRHEGNVQRLILKKWCFILGVERICNKTPTVPSVWADSASSRYRSTYITLLSVCSVGSFWIFALAYWCVTGIFHPVWLFVCRRECWNVLKWKAASVSCGAFAWWVWDPIKWNLKPVQCDTWMVPLRPYHSILESFDSAIKTKFGQLQRSSLLASFLRTAYSYPGCKTPNPS